MSTIQKSIFSFVLALFATSAISQNCQPGQKVKCTKRGNQTVCECVADDTWR